MFDDQNQPSPTGQNNQPPTVPNMNDITPSSSAGPRSIPPAGEVQSKSTVMPKLPDFSNGLGEQKSVDSVSTSPKTSIELPDLPKVNHAEDMFENTEGVPMLEEVPQKPVQPPTGPRQPLTELPDDIASDQAGGKMKWLIILIVVIILGAGGYYAYGKFFSGLISKNPKTIIEDPLNINNQPEEVNTNVNEEPEAQNQINENTNLNVECPQLTPPSPSFCEDGEIIYNEDENGCPLPPDCLTNKSSKDSDKDGLTDDEEDQYGTDPFEPDSDGDNLFDREEVKVWHTNPLNPDSDNDGYLDGSEVDSGYNPLGPGKLLDLNFEQ